MSRACDAVRSKPDGLEPESVIDDVSHRVVSVGRELITFENRVELSVDDRAHHRGCAVEVSTRE